MNSLPGNHEGSAVRKPRRSLFPLTDRLFDEMFGRDWLAGSVAGNRGFPIDVAETDASYVIRADLPGVKNEDVDITFEDGALTLSVQERKESEENVSYLHRERWLGFVARSLTLPREINPERIDASLRDGVLTIKIEKNPEKQARKIKVTTS